MKAEEMAMDLARRLFSGAGEDAYRREHAQAICAAALTLAQQEARAERDREWRDAWAKCGHFQTMTVCDRECALRALLEGK